MTPAELAKFKERGGASPKVVTVHGVRTDNFQVLQPSEMQYRSRAQSSDWAISECSGCIFRDQASSVCLEAARLAVLAGGHDCDEGYIYVAVLQDERQLVIDADC